MGLNISEAVEKMREGAKVRRGGWGSGDPSFLVLIPGREVTVTFKPMVDHLGEGAQFWVQDHVDAFYDLAMSRLHSKLGYQFTQADILTRDWYVC